MISAIIYLLAIIIAEVITVALWPTAGVICHIVILLVVIVHSAINTRPAHRALFLSLGLVPLVRIISLSMPLADIPRIWWYLIIYMPLLVAAIVVMRILNYSTRDTGINARNIPWQLVIALSGLIFGVAEYYILRPEAIITEFTWEAVLVPALILGGCTGFVEELIFRGVLQRSAVSVFGDWGIVYVSLLFAILHMGFLSWVDVVFVFIVALFFGWVVKKTGSLLGVTLSHGLTNVILFLVAPLVF